MLARARERAAGRGNLDFVAADAQEAALDPGRYDALHSRFGVMFFDRPADAFANLHRSLRPDGRLAFVCWRGPQDNPWITAPMAAVAPLLELPAPPPPDAPGMFSFADADRVRAVLTEAGFREVAVTSEDVAMSPGGGTLEEARDVFVEVGPVARILREAGADEALRQRVGDAVAEAYAAFETPGGALEMQSGVWMVTARA